MTPTFSSIVDYVISGIFAPLVPILVALALLLFLYGLVLFIWSSNNPEKTESGRTYMFWGIIALFVMTSLWGIVKLVQNSFIDVTPSNTEVVNLGSVKRNIFR